jgi:thiopurine S-methyltransferase
MDPQYWHARWSEGRTGWHQDAPTPLMTRHWPALDVAPGGRVFVPLAGKSQDMHWLAARGYRVRGVELSQLAIEEFFRDSGLEPQVTSRGDARHYEAGGIEIICGDAFALDDDLLRDCDAVFDRAALIALPPPLRQRYADELYARLPAGCRGLLITIDYPQDEKAGPPFSVPESEVRSLFAGDWSIECLERLDILEQERAGLGEGLSTLHTTAYRLARR